MFFNIVSLLLLFKWVHIKLLKRALKKNDGSSTSGKVFFWTSLTATYYCKYIYFFISLFSSLLNYFLSKNKAEPDVLLLVEAAVAPIFLLLAYMFFFRTGERGMQAAQRSPGPTTEFQAILHQSLHPSSHGETCSTADPLSQPHAVLLLFRTAQHVCVWPVGASCWHFLRKLNLALFFSKVLVSEAWCGVRLADFR